MAKRKKATRQAVTVAAMPERWDMGAQGQANRVHLVQEPVTWRNDKGETVNPNNVKRMRRVDMLEVYANRGWISKRGFNAGEKLRGAWEDTMRGPGWSDNDRVQSTSKPDQAIAMRIDRISALVGVSRKVPVEWAGLIEHVAINQGAIAAYKHKGKRVYLGINHEKGKRAVCVAFDALADALNC